MSFFDWFTRKKVLVEGIDLAETEELKPGDCECGHTRCSHIGGLGRCTCAYPPDKEWPEGANCACKIYIRDDRDDDDDEEESPEPTNPEVEELERVHKL